MKSINIATKAMWLYTRYWLSGIRYAMLFFKQLRSLENKYTYIKVFCFQPINSYPYTRIRISQSLHVLGSDRPVTME